MPLKICNSLCLSITEFEGKQKYKSILKGVMVGPQDGGFGFDGAPKYSSLDDKISLCVQCQAGQHSKCLAKNNPETQCDCELCLIS